MSEMVRKMVGKKVWSGAIGATLLFVASAGSALAADAVNSATVTAPVGVTDPNTFNNSSTDTDLITYTSDLVTTKLDGVTNVAAGGTTTYTVRVTNNGPSSVTGATFSDPVATGLTKTAIACSGSPGQCTAGTTPTIAQLEGTTFALPTLASGQFYEVTIAADVTAASGTVTNVATATVPVGTTDPTPGNATATDVNTVTPKPVLTLAKTLVNTGGGTAAATDWTLAAAGPTNISGVSGNAAVTSATVNPGTYTLSESGGPSGYTAGDYSCVVNGGAAVSGNSLALVHGDTAVCTVTNTFQRPRIRLSKELPFARIDPSDQFTLFVDQFGTGIVASGTTTGSATAPVQVVDFLATAGTLYSIDEEMAAGSASVMGAYEPTTVCTNANAASTTPLPNGIGSAFPITPAAGDDISCTLVNNPNPRITLVKQVTNDNGATAAATDWTLEANSPTWLPISGTTGDPAVTDVIVGTGTYTLSESGGPSGYSAGNWSCSAGTLANGNELTLGYNEFATCTIINDDIPATLTLAKTLVNAGGGTAAATDWTLAAAGPTNISGVSGNAAVTSATVNPGTYTLSESGGPSGYTAGDYSCVVNGGAAVSGNSLALVAGDTAVCTVTNTFVPAPALTIDKTASVPTVAAGINTSVTDAADTISYAFVVTNTGNVPLTSIVINDAKLDAAATCDVTSIAIGGTANCTGTHTITQAEVDAGTSNNTATASGTPPTGPAISSPPDSVNTAITRISSMTIDKQEAPGTPAELYAGYTVTWNYIVTNTGNVTLTGVNVKEDSFNGTSGVPVAPTGGLTTLAPGQSTIFSATYTLTQADVEALQ